MAHNPIIPLPTLTFIPPNHISTTDTPVHREFVINYLVEEERLGRISAPYLLEIVQQCYRHIHSSPLGVIDKATPVGKPQKYCLITDASHEDAGGISINSFIDSDEFPTCWHGVKAIAQLVRTIHSIYFTPYPHNVSTSVTAWNEAYIMLVSCIDYALDMTCIQSVSQCFIVCGIL